MHRPGYDRRVLPRLLAWAMRHGDLVPYRKRVGRAARGHVLEIGMGSGLNLPLYGPSVTGVTGIDPSPALLTIARARQAGAGFPVEFIEGTAEVLPLDQASVDTVVTTWTLYSVGDPA